jgi:hypothetical protein
MDLRQQLLEGFDQHSNVEISLYDGRCCLSQVYSGPPLSLARNQLQCLLTLPACFYAFQVLGVDAAFAGEVFSSETLLRRHLWWLSGKSACVV